MFVTVLVGVLGLFRACVAALLGLLLFEPGCSMLCAAVDCECCREHTKLSINMFFFCNRLFFFKIQKKVDVSFRLVC